MCFSLFSFYNWSRVLIELFQIFTLYTFHRYDSSRRDNVGEEARGEQQRRAAAQGGGDAAHPALPAAALREPQPWPTGMETYLYTSYFCSVIGID